MADSQTPADGQVIERIDISQEDALDGWATKLDVTPDQLREAVQAVGDKASDVELHLKGSRATTNAEQQAIADEAAGGSSGAGDGAR